MKIHWLCTLLLAGAVYAAEEETVVDAPAAHCGRPAAEVEVAEDLYGAGSMSSVVLALQSGNTADAIESLGSELAVKVLTLNSQLETNPCKLPPETLKRIYPIFRVIAAANAKKPIPGLNDNVEAMAILKKAVADNPEHYKSLIERSADWEHGIR
jgi:hypothetical protein